MPVPSGMLDHFAHFGFRPGVRLEFVYATTEGQLGVTSSARQTSSSLSALSMPTKLASDGLRCGQRASSSRLVGLQRAAMSFPSVGKRCVAFRSRSFLVAPPRFRIVLRRSHRQNLPAFRMRQHRAQATASHMVTMCMVLPAVPTLLHVAILAMRRRRREVPRAVMAEA